ncbi:MAG: hypothetical protein IJO94_02690 [Firmicutes bacterium]|nr:hypothetical protein [Bacillota bacterium]
MLGTVLFGVVAFLSVISLGGLLISLLDLAVYGVVLLIGAALSVGVCVLFHECPKYRKWLLIGGSVLFVLLLILSGKDGFAVFMNSIKDFYGAACSRVFLPYAVSADGNERLSATLFLLVVTMAASVIATYALFARSKVIFCMILVFLPLTLIPALISPRWIWYVVLGFSLALSMIVGVSGPANRGGNGFVLIHAAALVCGVFLMLLPLGFGFGFEKPTFFEQAESSFLESFEELRYGRDKTNNFPEGDLDAVDSFVFFEDTALEITISDPQSLYLRGYVGTEYTEEGWTATDKADLYEYADLFYWLHADDFFGTSQICSAAKASGQNADPITVTVKNVNAKQKYIYAPYELLDGNSGKAAFRIGDVSLNEADYKDASLVTYTMFPNQVRNAGELSETLRTLYDAGDEHAVSYLEKESAYREFVYATSLGIPEEAETVLQTHLGKPDLSSGHGDYCEAIQNIYDVLLMNTTYNEDCGPVPEDVDFLRYFLEISTEGYSVHYATAATLMFRYYGIPARYVEGYIVTPEDVSAAEGDTIAIDGGNAHAWVEYYRDGVGWIPLETTPPYLFIMEQPGEIQSLVSDTLDQSSTQSGMVQMEDDNYEEIVEEDKKPQEESSVSLWVILAVVFAVLLLLLFAAVVFLILRRRKKLSARQKQIEEADPRDGVDMLFDDALHLLFAAGIDQKNGSLDRYIDPLREDVSSDIDLRYKMFCDLHREARFSDHPISAQRKKVFYLFRKEAEDYAKAHSRLIKRLIDQYIHNRY